MERIGLAINQSSFLVDITSIPISQPTSALLLLPVQTEMGLEVEDGDEDRLDVIMERRKGGGKGSKGSHGGGGGGSSNSSSSESRSILLSVFPLSLHARVIVIE